VSTFLTELSRRVAERWLTLLVLPGLLFVGVAVAGAGVLGHRHWNELGRLHTSLTAVASDPVAQTTTAVALAAAALLGCAAGAGLLAQALSRVIERMWLGDWPGPMARLAEPLVVRRRRRWTLADNSYRTAVKAALRAKDERSVTAGSTPVSGGRDAQLARLHAARNRISLSLPQRATWIGDRLLAVDARIHQTYDLDLVSAWPRLWLLVPDATRSELRDARQRFDATTRLAGWGTLYVLLGAWWWPAAVLGVIIIGVAWVRGRSAIDLFAELAEATVDVHGRNLARALGIECVGALTPEDGLSITRTLRKQA